MEPSISAQPSRLRLHLRGFSATEHPGGAPGTLASPELPPDEAAAISSSLYYGSPEELEGAPPFAWSVTPLGADAAVLSRAWRPSEPGTGAAGPLVAVSVRLPGVADLLGAGRVLNLAEDRSLFPADPLAPPPPPLERPLPEPQLRLRECFGALLRLVRGERAALESLVAAQTSVAEGGGPLRAVILALPGAAFADDLELLRAVLGLVATVPRRQRAALSFATYQDSPSPRPLRLLAIPEGNRCIPRVQRAPGYAVFPGPPPGAGYVLPRAAEYAASIADLLLRGRFEEAEALATAFDLHGTAEPTERRREIVEHAALIRLLQEPSADAVLAWLAENPLPEEVERRRLLFDGLARALSAEAREGNHATGAQLLRTLGARWDDPDWTAPLPEHLRGPLVAFLRSWYEASGWTAIVTLLGRTSTAAVWLRELLVGAVADAAATLLGAPGPEDAELLSALEGQFRALPEAAPPSRYLRWRIRYLGDEDGRARAYVLRMARGPQPREALLDFFCGFESPHHPLFADLLDALLVELVGTNVGLVPELVRGLVTHFGGLDGDGMAVLAQALDATIGVGAESLSFALVSAHALPAEGLSPGATAALHRLLVVCGRALSPDGWAATTRDALEADVTSSAGRAALSHLRTVWAAATRPPGQAPTELATRWLRAIHGVQPALALEPQPHTALVAAGGAPASATLALDDLLLLSARVGDDEVRCYLSRLLTAIESAPGVDLWQWQRTFVAATRQPALRRAERAVALWWLWAVTREDGRGELARHAARLLLHDNLLPALPEPRFEVLCRLLPSETELTRERLVLAAVEGVLLLWSERPGMAVTGELFLHFSPQADSLSAEGYRRCVERYAEACLLFRSPTAEDLRTFLDRVYVPRHWESLAEVMRGLTGRRPRLRGLLHSLRRTTLGRRLPPQLLGAIEPGSSARGEMGELDGERG